MGIVITLLKVVGYVVVVNLVFALLGVLKVKIFQEKNGRG